MQVASTGTRVEEMKNMEEREQRLRERVSRLRTALTVLVPFFGHLLLKLDPRPALPGMGIGTAAVTRDRRLYLNVEFCENLTDPELAGLLIHEVMHPAFLCWERQGSRHTMATTPSGQKVSLWNVAHDYAINGIIDEMIKSVRDIKLPANGCLDRAKYDNWSAEEIYDDLLQNLREGKQPGYEGWGTSDIRDDLTDGEGDEDPGDSREDKFNGSSRSEAENRNLDNYWKVAVVEAAQVHQEKKRGDLPGALQKLIDSIVDPKINWVDALSRWMGENGRRADFTYRRPARRSEAVGELLPSLQKHGVDDLVVLWDTSGSMNGREKEILSEVIGITMDLSMSLRVICVDTAIHSDQEDVEDPEDIDVKGGGGSDFTPAFNRLHEEGYQGVVVAFTDGIIGVPSEKPPHIRDVLWVLWQGKDVDPTQGRWGEVMVVDNDGNIVNTKTTDN